MRIILHIGDSKTGSTALQVFLRKSSQEGALCYPGQGLNHNHLAHALTRRNHSQFTQDRFRAIWREVNQAEASVSVISAEHFQTADPTAVSEAITRFWPHAEVTVCAYVRPHFDKICGMFSERIKFGAFGLSLEEYAQRMMRGDRLDLGRRFDKWRAVFGAALVLRAYSPDTWLHGDIVQDFSGYFLPCHRVNLQNTRRNSSLSATQILLMRQIPELCLRLDVTQPIPSSISRLIHLNLRKSGIGARSCKMGLGVETISIFQDRYQRDAQILDRILGNGDVMCEQLTALCETQGSVAPTQSECEQFEAMAKGILCEWRRDGAEFTMRARAMLKAQHLVEGDPIAAKTPRCLASH